MVSSNHLDPEAVGQRKASVDTTGTDGLLTKHISVYSNDGISPVLSLTMTVEVVKK